jgi:hypothetical protein
MAVDVLRPKGKSCESCKHISEEEHSGTVLMDFGYKGHYWKCELRSHYDPNEFFPREVIVYTCGSGICSGWESVNKKGKK